MQTDKQSDINSKETNKKQALVSAVCIVVDRLDTAFSAADRVVLSCSTVLMPFLQVLLLCSYNLNFDPRLQGPHLQCLSALPTFFVFLHPVVAFVVLVLVWFLVVLLVCYVGHYLFTVFDLFDPAVTVSLPSLCVFILCL